MLSALLPIYNLQECISSLKCYLLLFAIVQSLSYLTLCLILKWYINNKANLRDLIGGTGLVILLKVD